MLAFSTLGLGCTSLVAAPVPPPLAPSVTLPEDSPAHPFLGTYNFIGGDAERAGVDKAIDDSIKSMTPLVRAIVRGRLAEANGVPKQLFILASTKWFEVRADGFRYVSNTDGTPYRVKTSTGDVMDLTYKFGDTLEQRFADVQKERINTFELRDNHLIMHVKIKAEVLPKDINYDLTFERAAAANPPAPAATTTSSPAAPSSG